MGARFNPQSKSAQSDCFGPPKKPVAVMCIHCGKEYASDQMIWGRKKGVGARWAMWWCATPECYGAGFGVDVKEVRVIPDKP